MSWHNEDSTVEQILFGLTAHGGIGPVDWSGGLRQQDVHDWDARLNRYNRLSPTYIQSEQWVPDEAFSYFEYPDGSAALLARFRSGEVGRNNSHALIGPARALAPYALYLSDWDGWRREPVRGQLSPASREKWAQLVARWQDSALLSAGEYRAPLRNLVRAVLATEPTYFAVLNHPRPLPLLTLARGVLGPVLPDFPWTFSTYEVSDTSSEASPQIPGAPRFWCVRSRPDSGLTERHRVEVDEPINDDDYAALAMELVDAYLKDPSQFEADVNRKLAHSRGHAERVADLLNGTRPPMWSQPVYRSEPPMQQYAPRPAHEPQPLRPNPEPWTGAGMYGNPQPAQPVVGNRGRRSAGPVDVHGILDLLARDDLPLVARQSYVRDLHRLWDDDDGHYQNFDKMLRRFEARLRLQGLALAIAVLISVLTAFLTWVFWPSPVSSPSSQGITVTEGGGR
ncbi:hypothetical protein DMH04_45820 [Kibdelosporangium aridum]|uniref:Uncharacterized protein n=1 Tax=Kibdelosporangium aridum TaxID=2030 RepID=A0A428YN71_KIBAR|nr:hypothetical protein [Kibdelosporangium aridum]RSM69643.1 hypothetical protein DMH04_45820 [Kibdelosporangium aridum]